MAAGDADMLTTGPRSITSYCQACYVATHARKLQSLSLGGLFALREANEQFDLVYVDGNHEREAVLLDSTLSWPLLSVGGLMIWDDYVYYGRDSPAHDRPAEAINGFLLAHNGEFKVFSSSPQMIVVKTEGRPDHMKADAALHRSSIQKAWQVYDELQPSER